MPPLKVISPRSTAVSLTARYLRSTSGSSGVMDRDRNSNKAIPELPIADAINQLLNSLIIQSPTDWKARRAALS